MNKENISTKEQVIWVSILFIFVFIIWFLVEGKKKMQLIKKKKEKK